MTDGALADVVVLELATGVAGPYCGKLFADLGAQVIKVEPEGGDPIRREPPLAGRESAFFHYLNANKLGVRLDLPDTRIDGLARRADIVIHNERGVAADALDGRLRAASARASIVSLTPYGRSGARSGWKASALTEWATGGYHYFGGHPEREPIALPGYQAEFHAGMHAAVGALAALWHVRDGGAGQVVEVSHQEAVLSDHSWLVSSWTHMGKVQSRAPSLYAPCADGFIYLFPMVPYPNLFVLMERFDLLEDEALQNPLIWNERWPEIFAAFSEWAATRTKREIYHACQELRVAASPVNTMADVAASEQLEARHWFATLETDGRSVRSPGFPYRLMDTPCESRFPAPPLGEHTAIVLAEDFAWASSRHPALTPNPSPAAAGEGSNAEGPLAGLRLIEVTGNWAGPIAGRHLADLGADVIKVELATKPATRALIYVGDDLWPEHYHRSAYFNKLNRNKRDICLDLATPEGREVFLKLVANADAVLENNAARVMTQLGIGYESLCAVNPALVMCSMSGFGSTGPERNYSAYGSNIETLSGLASLLGYGDGQFFGTGSFYADPITGTHGTIAILASLHARRRTGRGQWIDMALLEAVAPFFAQQFLDYTISGGVPEPLGNGSEEHSPHGVYRAFGKDAWIAVAVQDNQDWSALCAVIGRQEWAAEPALRTPDGRRARRGQIDAAISDWCSTRDRVTASEALQAAGVPAAPVMPNWEIISDNHLHERDFFVSQSQPRAGTFLFPGFPWQFSETPARVRMPAPLFGQHNREVFREVACLSDDEIEALYAAGVTSDTPRYSLGPGL